MVDGISLVMAGLVCYGMGFVVGLAFGRGGLHGAGDTPVAPPPRKERQWNASKNGIYIEPIGGHETDPFAAQDLPLECWPPDGPVAPATKEEYLEWQRSEEERSQP